MPRPIVDLKGFRDGLHLIIDPAAPIEQIEPALEKRMVNLGEFLAGTAVSIDIGSRSLKNEELDRLKTLLDKKYGLEVKRIIDQFNRGAYRRENPRIAGAPAVHKEEHVSTDQQLPQEEEQTRFIRHTLRSGQTERFWAGNIVILGDVNPGAEVTAAGDIIVLGTLRGVAHAGALGETSSVIIALNLVPTQLRIGQFITRPPNSKQRPRGKVEIVRVKSERIIVEEFRGL